MGICFSDGMLDGCGSERDCGALERGMTTTATSKSRRVSTLGSRNYIC